MANSDLCVLSKWCDVLKDEGRMKKKLQSLSLSYFVDFLCTYICNEYTTLNPIHLKTPTLVRYPYDSLLPLSQGKPAVKWTLGLQRAIEGETARRDELCPHKTRPRDQKYPSRSLSLLCVYVCVCVLESIKTFFYFLPSHRFLLKKKGQVNGAFLWRKCICWEPSDYRRFSILRCLDSFIQIFGIAHLFNSFGTESIMWA